MIVRPATARIKLQTTDTRKARRNAERDQHIAQDAALYLDMVDVIDRAHHGADRADKKYKVSTMPISMGLNEGSWKAAPDRR